MDALEAGSTSRHQTTSSDEQSSEVHPRNLIFINQFSKDNSRAKHGPSRRIVSSYVQRYVHRARRAHAIQSLRPNIWSDVKLHRRNSPSQLGADSTLRSLPKDQIDSAVRGSRPIRSIHNFPPPQHDQGSNVVPTTKDISGRQWDIRNLQDQMTQVQTQVNSPRTCLDMGVVRSLNHFEVFRTSPPSLTRLSFYYFLETVVPKISVSVTAKEHRHWIFQASIANPELLFASATVSAASALAAGRQSDTDVPILVGTGGSQHAASKVEALWFKSQAVRLLNARIANSNSLQSDTVPYAIMCLLLAAILAGDQYEIMTHATGLRKLIELRGTYVGLPTHVVAPILSSFYVSCAICGIPPISPPQMVVETDEVRTIFSVALEAYPSLRKTGRDFTHSKVTACLNRKTVKAFREMCEYVILREYFQRSGRVPTASQSDYFESKCMKSHFLVAHGPSANEIVPTDRQEPCRLALLIFWNANTQLNGPESMLYRTLASRLKSALQAADLRTFCQESFPVVMWILLLGAFISSDRAERPWFLANMAEGMRLSGKTHDWQWMKTVLLRLLYLDNIYRDGFERNWKEASALTVFSVAE